jgi:hypothetical protein
MADEPEDVFGTLKPEPKPGRAPLRSRPVERPLEPAPLVPAAPAPPPVVPPPTRPRTEEQLSPHANVPPAPAAPFSKSARRLAVEVARWCSLSADARQLLDEKQLLLPYLYRLMSQKLYLDAVRFLAHSLPVREAIWWACRCVRGQAEPMAREGAALRYAEQWITAPSEDHRRACASVAAAAGYGTGAGSAALAVFLSGGSIAPVDRPAANPSEATAAKAVANAVLLAGLTTEPQQAPERWFQFLKEGIVLLTGASPLPPLQSA